MRHPCARLHFPGHLISKCSLCTFPDQRGNLSPFTNAKHTSGHCQNTHNSHNVKTTGRWTEFNWLWLQYNVLIGNTGSGYSCGKPCACAMGGGAWSARMLQIKISGYIIWLMTHKLHVCANWRPKINLGLGLNMCVRSWTFVRVESPEWVL